MLCTDDNRHRCISQLFTTVTDIARPFECRTGRLMIVTRRQQAVGFRMGRRSFVGAAAIGCAICRWSARALAEETAHAPAGSAAPHWTYEGEAGAAHWGDLTPAFKVCQLGLEQSPIDLATAVTAETGGLDIAYQPMKLRIVNNGHTIQVNAAPGSSCAIGGTSYELQQFHFHHPSEHLLSGKPFDLECHLVHRSPAGDFAVLGVFIKAGENNAALEPIWRAMPRQAGREQDAGLMIDARTLLPGDHSLFRYVGSLTTPPCTQGIVWTLLRQPIEASPEQIRQFAALYAANARPTQGRNRRFVLQSS
jgi:carbonic anhydrase